MNRKTRSCSSPLFRKQILVLLVLLTILFVCGGCEEKGTETVRISMAIYSQDDTFIDTVTQEMEQLARDYEKENDIKINLNLADGQSNQTIQLEQIDRFLDSGCDVLCVNIVDRTAAAVLIDKAKAAGIPVIFFNREPVKEDLERWEKVYYVGAQRGRIRDLPGRDSTGKMAKRTVPGGPQWRWGFTICDAGRRTRPSGHPFAERICHKAPHRKRCTVGKTGQRYGQLEPCPGGCQDEAVVWGIRGFD